MAQYVQPAFPEYRQIIESLMRADALLEGHRRILELMSKRASLFNVLHELVSFLEGQYDELSCSILIVDQETQTFKVGVKACDTKNFSLESSGVSILPPYVGPCCMASHLGERVVSEHIATDSRWQEPWRAWAIDNGLRSCRSQPIISSTGTVLGAFAMYHKEANDPAADKLYQLQLATLIAGIAIERKLIEAEELERIEQQRRLNEDLSHALDLRDEFLSLASHELRNPLNTLQLQNHVFQKQLDSGDMLTEEQVRRMLTVSRAQLNRLVRYVETMLDASRFQPGKIVLKREHVDLARLIADNCEGLRPQLDRAQCRLHLCLTDAVMGTWDPFRIGQVVTNLVDNAIKYAPRSTITVTMNDLAERVRFSVRDSGTGIDPAHKDKIFERYERASHAGGGTPGLGLGLYIVKEIVHAHHGTIEVASARPGAEFIVDLPKVA
ncbi:MAG: GAF domain-containing sensor histidine kinase [Labilithrix sp.]|nr:GAF domain-containing sensor histidine kinase [Labilithrix sp.]MCW5810216.1 GAF domain-containing sensor histidine kinase [Labilithrix sp.]